MSPIRLTSVGNAINEDAARLITDRVEHPVVTNSKSVSLSSTQLTTSKGRGLSSSAKILSLIRLCISAGRRSISRSADLLISTVYRTSPPTLPLFQVLAEGPGGLFPSFFYCREVHQVSPEIFVLHETTKNRLSLGLWQGSKSGKKNFCQRLGLAHREAPFVIQAIATVLPT